MLFKKKSIEKENEKSCERSNEKKDMGIYVHIPFCLKKCNYCDFLSGPADECTKDRYVKAICKEMSRYDEIAEKHVVKTIYFGGGTPSILEFSQIEQILNEIRSVFEVDPESEITIEVNPKTADKNKFEKLREIGFNRLSIGAQSSSDEELKLLGRVHTFSDTKECVKLARAAGFDNLSLDVISALPKQSFTLYQQTLKDIVDLKPEHISSYSLIIENGTPFAEIYGEGKPERADLPDEETDRKMYAYTKEFLLQNGYSRYEISNYAKPGYESKHNSSYWVGTEYLGIGAGASSFIGNSRYHNVEDVSLYMEKTENEEDLIEDVEVMGTAEVMEEFMILGLRMMKGVTRESFKQRFGVEIETIYGPQINKLCRLGLLENKDGVISLTEKGIDVSNQVFVEFVPEE